MTEKFRIDGDVSVAVNAEPGSGVTVLNAGYGANPPESKLQADFARNTGIWCPKGAREKLEDLMANHGFMAKELEVAWRTKSLGWTEQRGFIVFDFIGEAIFAWTMLIVAAGLYAYFLGMAMSMNVNHDIRVVVAILIVTLITAGMMYMPLRYSIRPRHIAVRVKRAMANKKNNK
jgi:hypothetical protein